MKANLLNDMQVKKAQPLGKLYRLADGERLYLQVGSQGDKAWVFRYHRPDNGKETMLTLGHYPHMGLKQAREEKNECNADLDRGIDPADKRKQIVEQKENAVRTFDALATAWFEKIHKPSVSERHYQKTLERYENHVKEYIGSVPAEELTIQDFMQVVSRLTLAAKPGGNAKLATARIILGLCTQICQYAVIIGWMKTNPCRELEGIIPSAPVVHYPALTEPKKIGRLLVDIDNYGGTPLVSLMLKIAPYVFVRPTELREGLWAEIDFAAAEWRIPAERMKMNQEHIVPLSRQVIELLCQLRQFSGHSDRLFPGRKKRFISSPAGGRALDSLGYVGLQTMHGFRTTASTRLNEMGYNADWIEKQLAHVPRNTVRAAYNRALYLQERRTMMQEWADYLDDLRREALAEKLRELMAR